MAKQKVKSQATTALAQTKRTGYKRKKNSRVNVLSDQLSRVARKSFKRAQYDKSVTFAQPEKK